MRSRRERSAITLERVFVCRAVKELESVRELFKRPESPAWESTPARLDEPIWGCFPTHHAERKLIGEPIVGHLRSSEIGSPPDGRVRNHSLTSEGV